MEEKLKMREELQGGKELSEAQAIIRELTAETGRLNLHIAALKVRLREHEEQKGLETVKTKQHG